MFNTFNTLGIEIAWLLRKENSPGDLLQAIMTTMATL